MAEQQTKLTGYHHKYASGAGWKYNYEKERRDLQRITDALGLAPGAAVLEIGCGEGFHSSVLYDLGFRVTGNEFTEEGITSARKNHPLVNYIQGDSLGLLDLLPHEHFDLILARGHSWYHYELFTGDQRGIDAPAKTRKMFELLKPGGHFVLRIRTDFSGGAAEDGVHMNTRQAYVDLFSPLGQIVYVTDSLGVELPDEAAARKSKQNIVIATRKPGGKPAAKAKPEPAKAEAPKAKPASSGKRPLDQRVRKAAARTVRKLRERLKR